MYDVKNSIRIYIAKEYVEERKTGYYIILVVYNNVVINTIKRKARNISLENIYFKALMEIFEMYKVPMVLNLYIDNMLFIDKLQHLETDNYWYNKINKNFQKHIIRFIEHDDEFSDYAKLLSQNSMYYDN